MRPIFTIHAGEYLVGSEIEKQSDLRVWIPSCDTGVDLLVTNKRHKKITTLQVKFSKDYMSTANQRDSSLGVVSGGWWKLDREKIKKSEAEYWVFVLYRPYDRGSNFVIIKREELLDRFKGSKTIQCYFTVVGKRSKQKCFDFRGLKNDEKRGLVDGSRTDASRDFTRFLDNWKCLELG